MKVSVTAVHKSRARSGSHEVIFIRGKMSRTRQFKDWPLAKGIVRDIADVMNINPVIKN